jgi:hypothetical protein
VQNQEIQQMMSKFIGTKSINAKSMNRQDYNNYRGWTLPKDEDGSDEGYLVEYIDGEKPNTGEYSGYVSWSPKEQFEVAYQTSGKLSFGHAVWLMRQGKKVARSGWNGSGMFIYLVPANSYPAQTDVARETFGEMVPYREYLVLKTAQNDIATWAPSGSDALAEDWLVVSGGA